LGGLCLRKHIRTNGGFLGRTRNPIERVPSPGTVHNGDGNDIAGSIAKSNSEPERQEQGKYKHPEDYLWLPLEFLHSRHHQVPEAGPASVRSKSESAGGLGNLGSRLRYIHRVVFARIQPRPWRAQPA